MRVLGVIPARGGSVRIPEKNTQIVGGMTLLERAIQCCLPLYQRFGVWSVVSTDSIPLHDRLCRDPRAFGTSLRGLSAGDMPIGAVLRELMTSLNHDGPVLLVEPTSPQRTTDLLAAVLMMHQQTGQSICTAHRGEGHTWVRNGGAWLFANPTSMAGPFLVYETDPMIDINSPEDLAEARRILGD